MKKRPKIYCFTSLRAVKPVTALMLAAALAALFCVCKLSSSGSLSSAQIGGVVLTSLRTSGVLSEDDLTKTVLRLSLPALTFSVRPAQEIRDEDATEPEPTEEETTSEPIVLPNTAETVTYQTAAENGYKSSDGIYINNQTDKSVDISSLLNAPLNFSASSDDPLVLIVHTHTSESYTPSEKYNYTPSDTDRTEDINYNMASVGEVAYETLTAAGINTIHDKSINDYPSYSGSYSKTLKLIESYIEKYPSIQIVLDIHRDAIIKSDGTKIRTAATINGEEAAQIMLVVGTDQSGLAHPDWQQNLSFALKLQYEMNELYPSLARPINLRKQRFNQHTAPGALIVEVGTNGNTLEEAKLGVKLFSDALIEVLSN
ncbi:MAG: stage II sporulation protein P [Clostridia bacterium]|nr:stage II sporulation protein P [Clostridia bacterium]